MYRYSYTYGSGGDVAADLPIKTGLQLWLDGADESTITKAVDNTVSLWEDKSINNNDATQVVGGDQPFFIANAINNKGGIDFSPQVNSKSFMDLTSAINGGDLTAICVVEITAISSAGVILASATVNNQILRFYDDTGTSSTIVSYDGVTTNLFVFSESFIGTPAFLITEFNNTESLNKLYLDGDFLQSVTYDNSINVGSVARLAGGAATQEVKIGEIIVYDRILELSELQQIYNYITQKWGITITPNITNVAGNVLWLDGQDDTKLTDVGGGEISDWEDKSGLSHDVTQSVSSSRPILIPNSINGHQALEFDGEDDFLENTSFQDFNEVSVFAVANYRDVNTVNEIILSITDGTAISNGPTLFRTFGATTAFTNNGLSDGIIDPIITDKARIYTGISNGITQQLYIDGTLKGSSESTIRINLNTINIGRIMSGSGSHLTGPIGEIFIYNRALPDSERIFIINYLANKWDITVFNNDISNNIMWLDAVDKTSVSLVGSDVVAWLDKSGSGHDVIQNTGSKKPQLEDAEVDGAINEMPTVVFDGVDDILISTSFPDITELTIIAVVRYDAPGTDVHAIEITESTVENDAILLYNINSKSAFATMSNGGTRIEIEKDEAQQLHVYTGIVEAPNMEYYVENILIGSAAVGTYTFPLDTLSVGGNSFGGVNLDGAVGEIFVYDRKLNTTELEPVITYLADKWGIVKPTNIPNNILWLDATDSTTITETDGAVSQWNDKSGLDNHVVQATGASQPNSKVSTINGLASIKFDGVDDDLINTSFPNINTYSIFIVGEYVGTTVQTLLELSNGITSFTGVVFDYLLGTQSSVTTSDGVLVGVDLLETPKLRIYTAILDGADLKYYVNSVLQDTDSAGPIPATISDLTIGSLMGIDFLKGSIGEIAIYDRALSDTEKDYILDYLSEKWAILDPTRIQGNVLWLDAADDVTITETSGDVSQWDDKSGLGNNVLQATPADQPNSELNTINGIPAIDFDGANHELKMTTFPALTKFSVFVVARYDSVGANQTIFELSPTVGSNNGVKFYYNDVANASRVLVEEAGEQKIVSRTEDAKLHIYAATLDGFNLRYYLDEFDSEVATIASGILSNTIANLVVGGLNDTSSQKLKGTIGEIIIYDRLLSESERETRFDYLERKWSVFDVPSVTSKVLWLDASDSSSITETAGDVEQWDDKSFTGNDLIQLTALNKPTIQSGFIAPGINTLSFDGVDSFLVAAGFTITNDMTIFCIAKVIATITNSDSILSIVGSDVQLDAGSNAGEFFARLFSSGSDPSSSPIDLINKNILITYRNDTSADTLELRINGVLIDSEVSFTAIASTNSLYLGQNRGGFTMLDGDIGEIIIANTDLPDSTILEIENYLSNKWRIPLIGI